MIDKHGWNDDMEAAPRDRLTPVDLWSVRGFRIPDCVLDFDCGDDDGMIWTRAEGHGSVENGGPFTHWRPVPDPPVEGQR